MVTMRRLSVKAIIQASEKIHTQINLCRHARIFDSRHSPRARFPFSSAFLFFLQPEPVKRLGFDMLSLIPCLIRVTGGFMSCCGVDAKSSGEEISKLRKNPH